MKLCRICETKLGNAPIKLITSDGHIGSPEYFPDYAVHANCGKGVNNG